MIEPIKQKVGNPLTLSKVIVVIDFTKEILFCQEANFHYSFLDIISVTKSFHSAEELITSKTTTFPFVVRIKNKPSFTFIANSEDTRELWIKAFARIFKVEAKTPKPRPNNYQAYSNKIEIPQTDDDIKPTLIGVKFQRTPKITETSMSELSSKQP